MFPKKMIMIIGIIVLIIVNIIILSVSNKRYSSHGFGRVAISLIAPFQEVVVHSIRFTKGIWRHYFHLVSVAKENDRLIKELKAATEKKNQWEEYRLSNIRLRKLLNFQKAMNEKLLPAEVTGRDTSSLFKAIIIDKGRLDGIKKGLPVVVPEGIAGQIIEVSHHYSKVMLIIDRYSAVDALIQRNRARGIIRGESADRCLLKYVLRKNEIKIGDDVISSGLDGVFPKGQRLGRVSEVVRTSSEIFQEIYVTPYVDFQKLEEVLVILSPMRVGFESGK